MWTWGDSENTSWVRRYREKKCVCEVNRRSGVIGWNAAFSSPRCAWLETVLMSSDYKTTASGQQTCARSKTGRSMKQCLSFCVSFICFVSRILSAWFFCVILCLFVAVLSLFSNTNIFLCFAKIFYFVLFSLCHCVIYMLSNWRRCILIPCVLTICICLLCIELGRSPYTDEILDLVTGELCLLINKMSTENNSLTYNMQFISVSIIECLKKCFCYHWHVVAGEDTQTDPACHSHKSTPDCSCISSFFFRKMIIFRTSSNSPV